MTSPKRSNGYASQCDSSLHEILDTQYRPYKSTYAWFLDLKDGKIVNASAFFDGIALNKLWELPAAAAQ